MHFKSSCDLDGSLCSLTERLPLSGHAPNAHCGSVRQVDVKPRNRRHGAWEVETYPLVRNTDFTSAAPTPVFDASTVQSKRTHWCSTAYSAIQSIIASPYASATVMGMKNV
jgi:hypothetical protein